MKTKLSLRIEASLLAAAKEYAKNEGKSLSEMVEIYLASLTKHEKMDAAISPKILKLMGIINLEEGNEKKVLTKSLDTAYKR
jgi:hypothetical protein